MFVIFAKLTPGQTARQFTGDRSLNGLCDFSPAGFRMAEVSL